MSKKQESRAGFGREVRKQMLDLGLSQREVAARVPMRYQYLNKMLLGNKAGDKYWSRVLEVLDEARHES